MTGTSVNAYVSCCCTTCATMHTVYFVCNTYLFTLSVNMLFSYLNCAPTSELRIRLSNSNILNSPSLVSYVNLLLKIAISLTLTWLSSVHNRCSLSSLENYASSLHKNMLK
jgi:hypothetical protein